MSGLVQSLRAAVLIGMGLSLGVSLTACGPGTAAEDGGGSATTVSLSAAPPVTPFGTATTAGRPSVLLTYSEAGGFTGTTTTIRITAAGKLTMTKTGTEPAQLTRALTLAQLAALTKLVNSTPLRGTCAHVIHPEAIIVTVAASGQKISCVDKLPAAARPLQAEVMRLAR